MIEVSPLDERVQLVVLAGHADLSACRALQRATFASVRKGHTRFLLDLNRVEDVEPGVLGALLRLGRQLRAVGGGLALVSERPASELFSTRVSDVVVARVANVDEALGLLAS